MFNAYDPRHWAALVFYWQMPTLGQQPAKLATLCDHDLTSEQNDSRNLQPPFEGGGFLIGYFQPHVCV